MATIDINGLPCTFPEVAEGVLRSLPVTTRTHMLAWKLSDKAQFTLTITAMLDTAYQFGAFERPPFYATDHGKAIVLLENPSRAVLDSIDTWLTWTIGCNHVRLHPYGKAISQLSLQVDIQAQDATRMEEIKRYELEFRRSQNAGSPLKIPAT